MNELVTISFVATAELKSKLEEWAKEDERSMSYILRKILEKEVERKKKSQKQEVLSQ